MSYKETLLQLKKARLIEQQLNTSFINKYAYLMTQQAKSYNLQQSQMLIDAYDRKILQIQPLAEQEQQEEFIQNVINNVEQSDKNIQDCLEKSLNDALSKLNFSRGVLR